MSQAFVELHVEKLLWEYMEFFGKIPDTSRADDDLSAIKT